MSSAGSSWDSNSRDTENIESLIEFLIGTLVDEGGDDVDFGWALFGLEIMIDQFEGLPPRCQSRLHESFGESKFLNDVVAPKGTMKEKFDRWSGCLGYVEDVGVVFGRHGEDKHKKAGREAFYSEFKRRHESRNDSDDEDDVLAAYDSEAAMRRMSGREVRRYKREFEARLDGIENGLDDGKTQDPNGLGTDDAVIPMGVADSMHFYERKKVWDRSLKRRLRARHRVMPQEQVAVRTPRGRKQSRSGRGRSRNRSKSRSRSSGSGNGADCAMDVDGNDGDVSEAKKLYADYQRKLRQEEDELMKEKKLRKDKLRGSRTRRQAIGGSRSHSRSRSRSKSRSKSRSRSKSGSVRGSGPSGGVCSRYFGGGDSDVDMD